MSTDCQPCPGIWGKDPEQEHPYPLLAHLLDTAVTAGAVWDHWLRAGLRDQITSLIGAGNPGRARAIVRLLAGIHDIGKANPLFALQAADRRDLAWRQPVADRLTAAGLDCCAPGTVSLLQQLGAAAARRHEYVGMVGLLGDNPDPEDRRLLLSQWPAVVAGGHHGRWQVADRDARAALALASGAWLHQQQAHLRAVEQATGITYAALPALDKQDVTCVITLLTGVVILADWLASDVAVVADGQALLASGHPLDPSWASTRTAMLTAHVQRTVGTYIAPAAPERLVLAGRSPRPLQADAISKVGDADGLWIVAYPTGEGKTEAALLRHTARVDEGLLFALPTRATTDAMTSRLRGIFNGTGNQVVKSHQFAAADRQPAQTGSSCPSIYATDWFTSSVRRLVAPVSAMTCDQILTGALRQRHAAFRLLSLANHHVVIDEVHTFDHYQTELLLELLSWLGVTGTRVTLLSATMPAWMQRRLAAAYTGADDVNLVPDVAYPSHRVVTGPVPTPAETPAANHPTTLHIDAVQTEDAPAAHLAWVTQSAAAHPDCHIAVVVNTVTACIDLAEQVRRALPGEDVMCLHSRMTQGHRAEVEQTLLDRTGPDESRHGRRLILIATQVVEASLDVDFDLMASDLAPSPSLLQRAGRLWRFHASDARTFRHAASATPPTRTLRVIARTHNGSLTFGSCLPYLASEMQRVWDGLTARPTIVVPDHVQGFVDETTVDLATFTLLLDQSSGDAQRELAEMVKRYAAAQDAKASLSTSITRPRRPVYRSLMNLTTRDDPVEMMTTRFIERPGHTYLLIDPMAARPDITWTAAATVASLLQASAAIVIDLLPFVVPVSGGRLDRELLTLHQKTLAAAGVRVWEPRSRMLRGLLPLDVRLLTPTADYSPFAGLLALDPDDRSTDPHPAAIGAL